MSLLLPAKSCLSKSLGKYTEAIRFGFVTNLL